MTFSMSVVDKSARLALEAEDEENAMSSKVGSITFDLSTSHIKIKKNIADELMTKHICTITQNKQL